MRPSAGGYRHRRLPERGRHLHRLHDARLPDKFMPFMDEPPGSKMSTNVVASTGGPSLIAVVH
jgi:hypothetical protein